MRSTTAPHRLRRRERRPERGGGTAGWSALAWFVTGGVFGDFARGSGLVKRIKGSESNAFNDSDPLIRIWPEPAKQEAAAALPRRPLQRSDVSGSFGQSPSVSNVMPSASRKVSSSVSIWSAPGSDIATIGENEKLIARRAPSGQSGIVSPATRR